MRSLAASVHPYAKPALSDDRLHMRTRCNDRPLAVEDTRVMSEAWQAGRYIQATEMHPRLPLEEVHRDGLRIIPSRFQIRIITAPKYLMAVRQCNREKLT